MSNAKTILITGASGNLGSKLSRHLSGGGTDLSLSPLRLLDIDPRGNPAVIQADLSQWDPAWVDRFRGVDAVVHLAADPLAHQTWPKLIGANIDGLINVFLASVQGGVKRIVFASSNHVMGGYKDDPERPRLTTEPPPRPGTHYVVEGQHRDSTPYGSAKLFGERLGKCFAEAYGLSVIAVRIGWVRPGENRPQDIPPERGPWFKQMWLSNPDFCQLMTKCILVDLSIRFAVINGMSANAGMPWDIEATRKLIGYEPQDDVTQNVNGPNQPEV
jgi:uronate dehydrogenase